MGQAKGQRRGNRYSKCLTFTHTLGPRDTSTSLCDVINSSSCSSAHNSLINSNSKRFACAITATMCTLAQSISPWFYNITSGYTLLTIYVLPTCYFRKLWGFVSQQCKNSSNNRAILLNKRRNWPRAKKTRIQDIFSIFGSKYVTL